MYYRLIEYVSVIGLSKITSTEYTIDLVYKTILKAILRNRKLYELFSLWVAVKEAVFCSRIISFYFSCNFFVYTEYPL